MSFTKSITEGNLMQQLASKSMECFNRFVIERHFTGRSKFYQLCWGVILCVLVNIHDNHSKNVTKFNWCRGTRLWASGICLIETDTKTFYSTIAKVNAFFLQPRIQNTINFNVQLKFLDFLRNTNYLSESDITNPVGFIYKYQKML